MNRFPLLIACVTGFASALPADGRTWRVAWDGSGDFEEVLPACEAAAPGDTIAISPGEYDEYDGPHWVRIEGKPLTILGLGSEPTETSLRLSLFFANSDGATIQNVRMHDEHCPLVTTFGDMAVRNCVFDHNTHEAWYGGAVAATDGPARLTIEDCLFEGNRISSLGGRGGAIATTGGRLSLRRCIFVDNELSLGELGGAVYASWDPLIEDCLFWRNRAARVPAVWAAGSEMLIRRCTFVENEVTGAVGAALEVAGGAGDIVECILAWTINGYGVGCLGPQMVFCSDVHGNELGPYGGDCFLSQLDGNIFVDPMFCGRALGDFRLMEGSPCLPGNHGGYECGRMGAYDVGCTSPTQRATWGRIKSMFRQ